MNEVSDIFKKGMEILHKKSSCTKGLQRRSQMSKYNRECTRHNLILQRRKIDPEMFVGSQEASENMHEEDGKKEYKYNLRCKNSSHTRIQMLAEWKKDKKKLLDDKKAYKKPIFKTGHVSSEIALSASSNNNVKGKVMNRDELKQTCNQEKLKVRKKVIDRCNSTDSRGSRPIKLDTKSTVQPSSALNDYKFKAPFGITPINTFPRGTMHEINGECNQTILVQNKKSENGTQEDKSDFSHVTKTLEESLGCVDSVKQSQDNNLQYVPNKENLNTSNCVNFNNDTTPFTIKLDNEINRIEAMCQQWLHLKENSSLPEEAHSCIDVTVGQSKLLLSKKFKQFRELISKCNISTEKKLITVDDLHGFWDMIYLQVQDLDRRFENLLVLQRNNWQENVPEEKQKIGKKCT